LTTTPQLCQKSTASKAPASQATSSRIAGRHHPAISGRHHRNPHRRYRSSTTAPGQWRRYAPVFDKNLSKAEFMMALGFSVAKATSIDAHLLVQGMFAELIQFTEFTRACLRASEADAAPAPTGTMTPASMPLWTGRMMYPKMFVRMCEIIQTLGAGALLAVPSSYAEFGAPAAEAVRTYHEAVPSAPRRRRALAG
jgi:aromatic ring hydroxylase